jgi:hypothetical protein
MPAHDIIDNRQEKLVDHINRILGSTEAARFAVGYFSSPVLPLFRKNFLGLKNYGCSSETRPIGKPWSSWLRGIASMRDGSVP